MQKAAVMPQLELVDFSTEVEVDVGLDDNPSHLLWFHPPVVPIDLHLRVFSARWEANN